MSLLSRLMLVVVIALVPALGFQAYTESEARRIRLQLVSDEALRLVRLVSAEQQRIIDGAEQVLNVISTSPFLQDNLPGLCERELNGLVRQSPRYNSATVIGLDGHRICASGPFDRDADLSGRAYFQRALQTGGTVVGEYTIGRRSGRPALHTAKPFRNRDGVVAGVVVLALDIAWLNQQLAQLPLPANAVASIADRNGNILARSPNGENYIGQPIPPEDRFSLQSDAIAIGPMRSLEGRQRIAASVLPGADPKGLRVWVGLDRDVTFAAVTQANRAGLLLILAGGGLALLVTALLGTGLIRRPAERLLRIAERWRSGDLAARSGLGGNRSEFGRLAAAFDIMAEALQARERALSTALESTTDVVMVLDRAWRFTYLNAHAKAYLPQDHDLLGQVIWEAFPGIADTQFGHAFRAAMQRGVPSLACGTSAMFGGCFEAHAFPSSDGLTLFFRDVTEQQRIAAALRENEELFRAAFEQAAVGMALVGLDGTWLRVNGRLCTITGYTLEELQGGSLRDISHPDNRAADLAQIQALLAGEPPGQLEMRYVRKDGSKGWGNVWGSVLHDSEGRPEYFMAVIDDITERKRAEAALRESETRLRLAQEAAGIGIWEHDLVSGATFWSPEQYHLHGLDPAAGPPTFRQFLKRVDPEDRASILYASEQAACAASDSAPGPWRLEFRICRASDGARRWMAALGQMIKDEAGRPGRVVGVNFDITERRQAEEDLRHATALLGAVGNCSPDPIYAKDTQGRFLFANPALLAIIGKTAAEVIGRTDAEWHHDPAQAEAVMANDRCIIETGRTQVLEESFDAAGLGPRVYRSAKAPLRMDDGSTRGVVGVSSDITQIKQTEAELRRLTTNLEARVNEEVAAREAAQIRATHAERLQALGQLAGGIAHDFNNVLQAVAGAAALIERRPEDVPGVRRLARLAIEATGRGASITGRLLAFGRRADLRAERLTVPTLLNGLAEMLAHTLGAGIEVQVSLASGLPPLLADKGQLETVLVNLATNARDAMPQGGRLVLAAAPAVVCTGSAEHKAGLQPGRYVRLCVADTGQGMDAATLAHAAEPFFTTKEIGAGTGLGLSIAKGFAEQSGGDLNIESRPGSGTTVTLWLPEAGSDREEAAPPSRDAAQTSAEAIATPALRSPVLLVDDDDLVRETTAAYLEDEGFRPLLAANGAEALALLDAGQRVDAVVTDLSMPGMDGIAVIRAAQQRRPGLPALLLTGYAQDEAVLAVEGAVSGGFSLLRKPVRGSELVDRVRALVAERNEPFGALPDKR